MRDRTYIPCKKAGLTILSDVISDLPTPLLDKDSVICYDITSIPACRIYTPAHTAFRPEV